jgi:hypothetical protein
MQGSGERSLWRGQPGIVCTFVPCCPGWQHCDYSRQKPVSRHFYYPQYSLEMVLTDTQRIAVTHWSHVFKSAYPQDIQRKTLQDALDPPSKCFTTWWVWEWTRVHLWRKQYMNA